MPRPQQEADLSFIECDYGSIPIPKLRALKQLAECLVPPDAPLNIIVDDDAYEDIAEGDYYGQGEAYDIANDGPWEEIEIEIIVADGDYDYALTNIDEFRTKLKNHQSWRRIPHGVVLMTQTEFDEDEEGY